MPFASINSTNPRTNPWNFHEKILRIGGAGKRGFFEAAILNFLSRPFWTFFCFISIKNWKGNNIRLRKKNQNGRLKKSSFFKIANSQYFFAKISQIGPWVSRIEWCEGHWCGSAYMTVRLSDISLNTAKNHKNCIFSLFLSLCRTASRPYRLSHTNALSINQFY